MLGIYEKVQGISLALNAAEADMAARASGNEL